MKIGNRNPEYKPNDEYYTPKFIFEALQITFDLDVASPHEPTSVPALNRFCKCCHDGLTERWHGNVWMNPPFSKQRPWIEKFVEHGRGIALLPWSKSRSLNLIWGLADGITMLPQTLRFDHKDHGQKSIFVAVGLFAFGVENTKALQSIGKVR